MYIFLILKWASNPYPATFTVTRLCHYATTGLSYCYDYYFNFSAFIEKSQCWVPPLNNHNNSHSNSKRITVFLDWWSNPQPPHCITMPSCRGCKKINMNITFVCMLCNGLSVRYLENMKRIPSEYRDYVLNIKYSSM